MRRNVHEEAPWVPVLSNWDVEISTGQLDETCDVICVMPGRGQQTEAELVNQEHHLFSILRGDDVFTTHFKRREMSLLRKWVVA